MRAILLAIALAITTATNAHAGDPLLDCMKRVDAKAKQDLETFHRTVAEQFGVPEVQVRAVVGGVGDPASAFMLFQLGHWGHQPIERCLTVYESHKGKGWGAMAKELGIKPGSAEFHALKNGDLFYGVTRASGREDAKGKGKPKKK